MDETLRRCVSSIIRWVCKQSIILCTLAVDVFDRTEWQEEMRHLGARGAPSFVHWVPMRSIGLSNQAGDVLDNIG